jgi:hypothetical protein
MICRCCLVCALVGAMSAAAAADNLRLGVGQSVEWNRAASPAASPVLTIPVLNDQPGADRISGWTISLSVRPLAGSTGTLALDPAAFAYPANSVINGARFALIPTEPVPGVMLVNGGDEEFFDTLNPAAIESVPASGRSLVDLRFLSADALGPFELFAVNDAAGFFTNWTDAGFNNRSFTNAPFAPNTLLRLAAINVVPEPRGAVTLIVGMSAIALACLLRRRQLQRLCWAARNKELRE